MPYPNRAIPQWLFAHYPVGTPDDCVEELTATIERTGLRHVLIMLEAPADQRRGLEDIGRFATEVLAKLPHPMPHG